MRETNKRLRGIVLTLTERCNLRCEYCYVPVERGRTMAHETADLAIDWFVANACDDGKLGLSFFGGEPFLAGEEMRRTTGRLRGLVPSRTVRVVVPTNVLAMSDEDIAWCRREDIELAISIDGGVEVSGRRFASLDSCAHSLATAVPDLLRKLPPGFALARMTVTPANVGSLCENIRTLARLGFERVVYLPDYDASWDEPALAAWRREHQRIATWLLGARSAGRKVPELPAWKAIEGRLVRGAPRRRCSAGIDQVTVAPDGEIYPCYRFPYAKDARAWRLGDVNAGIAHPEKIAQLEHAGVDQLRPERGDCASCAASDGCTHHCPALGFLASGEIDRVPETVCRLMEAQVASVRELCAAVPRRARAKSGASPWARAAAVAAAVTGMAACQQSAPLQARPDASDANQTRDVGMGGGICAVQLNPDAAPRDDLLPSKADGGDDGGQAVDADQSDAEDAYLPVGGVCPAALPPGGLC